jgi:putative FmdB family regulatory protein
MPIYEYRCHDCEQIFEEWQKDFTERSVDCPVCGNRAERIISNTSFVLKGSGWYVTDYAGNRTPDAAGNGKTKPASGNGNGNGTAKESSSGESKASSDSGSGGKAADTSSASSSS